LDADEPLHERLEVPEPPEIGLVERLQVRLVEFVVATSVTLPVKPLRGVTVMVDVPDVAALTVRSVGLDVMLKSGGVGWVTVTETFVE